MGFSERHAVKHMKTPVRGIFRVTDFYDARSSHMLTGVITAPGIPATPAEHKADARGRWVGNDELPVAVDAADPAKFVILWDEVDAVSWGNQEMQAAQDLADRLNAAAQGAAGSAAPFQYPGAPGFGGAGGFGTASGFGGGADFVSTVVIGPDGQPVPMPMSAETAAQLGGLIQHALDGLAAAPHGGFTPVQAAQMAGNRAGEQGTAVVLDAQDVPAAPGLPAPPGGQADILLEVTRADGTTYQTRTVIAFGTPARRAAIATPGTRLRVWIDPNAPARVAIDPTGMF